MMTSSNGIIFRVTGPWGWEFTGKFPSQRPVTRSFDVFFDLCLNKRFSKQSLGWWFETPSSSLWRYCNGQIATAIREWLPQVGKLSPVYFTSYSQQGNCPIASQVTFRDMSRTGQRYCLVMRGIKQSPHLWCFYVVSLNKVLKHSINR